MNTYVGPSPPDDFDNQERELEALKNQVNKLEKSIHGYKIGIFILGVCCLAFLGFQYIDAPNKITDILEKRYGNSLDAQVNRIQEIVDQNEPSWVKPERLWSGWSDYGAGYNQVEYTKNREGLVTLRGMAANGEYYKPILSLPKGYRPSNRRLFATLSENKPARIDILENGDVTPINGSKGWISLDGIQFYASESDKVND